MGSDLFIFARGSGRDTVKSVVLGIDQIDIGGLADAVLAVSGSSALLRLDTATTVTVTGITDAAGWTPDALLGGRG